MGAFAAGRTSKKQLKEREKNSKAFLHILRECSMQLEAVWQVEDDARARRRLNELKEDNPETFAEGRCGRRERERRKKAQRSRKLAKVEGIIVGYWTIHPNANEREVKVDFESPCTVDGSNVPFIKYHGFYHQEERNILIEGLKIKGNHELFHIQDIRDSEPNRKGYHFSVLSKANQPPPGPLPSSNDGYFAQAAGSPVTLSATSGCLTSRPEGHTPGSDSDTVPSISTPASVSNFSCNPDTTFDSILDSSPDDQSMTDSSSRLSSASRFSLSSLTSNLTGKLSRARSRIEHLWKR